MMKKQILMVYIVIVIYCMLCPSAGPRDVPKAWFKAEVVVVRWYLIIIHVPDIVRDQSNLY